MDQKKLLELQTQRGAKAIGYETSTKTLETVKADCRKVIEDKSEKYRELNPVDKKKAIQQIIVDFVMSTKPLVKGYIDGENRPDTLKLVDRLVEDITDYGILTPAMMDDRIYEVRANGKELKIEIEGRCKDLLDKDGNVISFSSPEEQEIIMRKLLGDVRLTPKDALINSRTIEGYRIAAVHSSAMSPDPNDPAGDAYHAFVLRKFRKSKMELPDIVRYKTMSDGMARLLALTTVGGLTFVTVGPTASGKTTTNNAILQTVPNNVRVILLQNPSEIDLRRKDATGRVINDVLHMEAKDIENPRPQDPTMPNMMDHTLRLSPTLVCFGELRTNKEFMLGMKILDAGHPVNATYHAENGEGAVQRFLTAYMAESGEGVDTALYNLTSKLNLIVAQKIMKDGTRKVLEITEVEGVDPEHPNRPKLNTLYTFNITGKPDYDAAGNVVNINGVHKRVGKISDKLLNRLKLEGIDPDRFDFLLNDPSETEVETYTGLNIEHYGMKLGDKQ